MLLTTYVVDTTADILNDMSALTLRDAITAATTHTASGLAAAGDPGLNTIDFSIGSGVQTIHLASALPTIDTPLTIDGTTQPGYQGTPLIDLNGAMAGASDGLDITSGGTTINGLAINRFDGNGIVLEGAAASGDLIENNFIGTDVTGTLAQGNAGNGILITNGATGNTIGGQATGGNDPTSGVFVRPPQGNLISANGGNGVLINSGATQNLLSGNYIGTDLSGNVALGNTFDGVAIDNADGNSLVGCALTTNPFVFYNVISGNGENGLQVTDSNNTTIQGNFFGLGANNQTPVGNRLNGVVVEGTSANTVMGGPIPLGNVDAANGQNGILVQDTASGFISYNTFCGLAAFQTYTDLGNGADGMKITSSGADIFLRTNVITENGNDGIEIGGAANGVRVAGNIIGLTTNGNAPMGNKNNGVEVDGDAQNVVIGGPQLTFNIIPHNAISANGGDGVAIDGNATNIQVSFSFIGTDLLGLDALGNAKAGVYIGPGASSITVGSVDPNLFSVISGNAGDGVQMVGTHGNSVVGCLIGTSIAGLKALPNGGDGVLISDSYNNTVGGTVSGSTNEIADNAGIGVAVGSSAQDVTSVGNSILGNSIFGNGGLGIDLGSNGVTPNGTDPRAFPNSGQNFPVLMSVISASGGDDTVSGTLTSAANASFRLEFFGNAAYDASGFGQGGDFLGSELVTTNASGVATFSFTYAPVAGDTLLTATATNLASGNTSEFSEIDQAPVISSPATQTATEYTPLAFSGANTISVSDADNNGTDPEKVTLSANHGVLHLGNTAGLQSINGNGTDSVTLVGTLTTLNADLASLTYTAINYTGADALSVAADDLAAAELGGPLTSSTSVALTVEGVKQQTLTATTEGSSSVVFTIGADGKLYQHLDSTGWTVIGAANTVESISAVTQTNGTVVLFAQGTDGALSRYTVGAGWQGAIGASGTIQQISAGLAQSGQADVFVIATGGGLAEWSASSGWRTLTDSPAGSAVQLSAVAVDRVYVLTADGSVYGNDPSVGWFALTAPGFARSISATDDGRGNDTVYAVTTTGGLYVHNDATGWTGLGASGTINTINAGRDSANNPEVFAVTTSGQIALNDSLSGWSTLNSPVPAVELSATSADRLFMVLSDGAVDGYEPGVGFFPLTSAGFAAL